MCGVLHAGRVPQAFPSSFSPAFPFSNDAGRLSVQSPLERESLDFTFESEKPVSQNAYLEGKAAVFGKGCNGRLLTAVSSGNLPVARHCLKYGANPNVIDKNKRSALHLATSTGNVDMMRLLLSAGAYHTWDKDKRTPLQIACISGNVAAIRVLLAFEPDPNKFLLPQSPLHYAIRSGNPAAVKVLVDAGADLNSLGFFEFNPEPRSPLGLALQQSNWRELVSILLDAGASTEGLLGVCMDATAFEVAALTGNLPQIQYLIQNNKFPSAEAYLENSVLACGDITYLRSNVALLYGLAQRGLLRFEMFEKLVNMLEAAGYNLRKDSFCTHLVCATAPIRPIPSLFRLLGKIGHEKRLTVANMMTIQEKHNCPSTPPTEQMLTYCTELAKRLLGCDTVTVPSLTAICRGRVRGLVVEASQGKLLEGLVNQLDIPDMCKRAVLLEDL